MKGGRGAALLLLLACVAIAVLLLSRDREPPPERAHRASDLPAAPVARAEPPPPEPPDLPPPEPPNNEAKPGARLVGRVTDEEGLPVAGAGIWLSKGMGPGEGEVVARAGEDGRYLYDGVDGEERLVGALAAKYAPSGFERIAPRTQAVFEIDFKLRRGGGTLAITVDDPEAQILVAPVFRGYPESLARRTVDAKGQATIDGLLPEWNFVRVRARGRAPQTLLTRLSSEGMVEADVKLGAGATVFGTARTVDGAPAPGAHVDLLDWEWAGTAVVADETGAYRVEHAPVALVEIHATGSDGAEAWTLLKLEEGKEYRWDPVLQIPADITGRVVDEGGAPVPQATLSCWRAGSARPNDEIVSLDPQGSFRLQGLPNSEYRIGVWWRGGFGTPPAAEVAAFPGGDPITIVLPRAQGSVRGVITTRDGRPAAGARARTWPTGAPENEVRTDAAADGSFRLGPLPAANYFLELHLDGEPTLHLGGIALGADEARDLGVLVLPAGGRIRARVVGDGEVEEETLVRSLDGNVTYSVRPGDGWVLSEDLAPGRYLVSGGVAGILEEAEVRPGETTEVELKLRGGGILEALALDASGAAVGAMFGITDPRGHLVLREYGPPFLPRIASGTYTVSAVDANGARDSREVTIPAGGGRTRVALALR
ncbi:MAG TPA: carboxypeptidase-like regulatory domain-containing protein [Planctomycetota bacterium]|nr:carboxypeptidase-like regulatory domain-containing protein [Planctomycetota bacterium]